MRARALIALFVLSWAVPAHAFLPNTIETVIRSWFTASGKFQCIKVSGGGTANCLFGANMTLANGCSVSGGIMTCSGGFDSPPATTTGSFATFKEGSNNGTENVKVQAPPNLAVSRVNLFNTDGTYKSGDVATATTQEYGLPARYSATNGILGVTAAINPAFYPDGTPAQGPGSALTTARASGVVDCVRFVARDSVVGATKLQFDVGVNLAATSGSVCLFNDSDSGTLIAPLVSGAAATAVSVASAGAVTMSGLDSFNIYAGTRYRLCWTSNNGTTTVRYSASGQYISTLNSIAVVAGTAASTGTSGKCPSTTGAISSGSVNPPIVAAGS